ncbi:MAG: Rossmann-fold NAD(P)-binding domain-containing protein, partial [Microthrixaceae bacterium]
MPLVRVWWWGGGAPPPTPTPFAEQSIDEWAAEGEWELALWFEAAVAGARVCADGGSVVVVTERPAALDSIGHGDRVMVAEGLVTLSRSLGICEGDRGVRVNALLTELTTAPDKLLGLPPLLASFPGTVSHEIAGAVRMLLSD